MKRQEIKKLTVADFEAAAKEISDDYAYYFSLKSISKIKHETDWRVFIHPYWYSPRMLVFLAGCAANVQEPLNELSDTEFHVLLDHLRDLDFSVDRGRTPTNNKRSTHHSAQKQSNLNSLHDPLDEELARIAAQPNLSTEVQRAVMARIGQGKFRSALIQLYKGCLVTGIRTSEVLRAAHIHRWADCSETPAMRVDINNGLLLTANLDALFEVGLISFDDTGKIIISDRLIAKTQKELNISANTRLLVTLNESQRMYLAKHRLRTISNQ